MTYTDGALYHRVLVMGRDIDRAWIDRILAQFIARTRDKPRRRNGDPA